MELVIHGGGTPGWVNMHYADHHRIQTVGKPHTEDQC